MSMPGFVGSGAPAARKLDHCTHEHIHSRSECILGNPSVGVTKWPDVSKLCNRARRIPQYRVESMDPVCYEPQYESRLKACGYRSTIGPHSLMHDQFKSFRLVQKAAILLLLLMIAGCSTSTEETLDQRPRFREWWNYYELGLRHLEQENYQGALENFEIAIGERPGARTRYKRDQWRVRTYGMHFLEGYFPNRELGIALYHSGVFPEAEIYLERSLAQAASGRAKHYLNRVRRERLKSEHFSAPVIEIAAASLQDPVNTRTLAIRGVAGAQGHVARIWINQIPEFLELAEPAITFAKEVLLQPGSNTVSVRVEDLVGQSAESTIRVFADWNPPQVTIQQVADSATELILKGSCVDDVALKTVAIDGAVVFSAGDSPTTRRAPITIRVLRSAETVSLEAEDHAGNRLVRSFSAADVLAWQIHDPRRMWASTRSGDETGGNSSEIKATGGTRRVDQLRPRLRLAYADRTLDVFDEEFFLDGAAEDRGGLQQLFINGEPLLDDHDEGALQRFFAQRLFLEEGTNVFTVEAVDLAGNTTKKTVRVNRRIAEYLDAKTRLSVGVPPPASSEMTDLTDLARRTMEEEILREPARFHLVERQEGWEHIMHEQELSVSDLADPSAALRIGKMLPAELLLMSGFMAHGTGLTVFSRVVSTSDGRMLFLDDVYCDVPEEDLAYQLGGLILKIEQRFPFVHGKVEQIQGDRATLSVGSEDGVYAGTRFVVVHSTSAPALRGRLCRSQGEIIQLEAERVTHATCVARILPSHGKAEVIVGDAVRAR
jgi:hypothetical protein